MTTHDRPECAVRDCWIPGQHATDCDDYSKCSGCLPGLAADGLLVCGHHRALPEKDLGRLPLLFAQLGDRLNTYRSPQAPKGDGGRSSEAPDVIDVEVFRIRQTILERLAVIAAYVIGERGLHGAPGGTVGELTAFLTREADWLCNHAPACAPHFWGDRIAEIRRDAARVVTRSRVTGLYLGACPVPQPAILDEDGRAHPQPPCGGSIRYDRQEARQDPLYQVTCPRCGTADSLLWWQRQIVGDVTLPTLLPAVPLAMFLADTLALDLAAAGRKLTATTLGKWKWTGEIETVACDLKTRRELFDRHDVEAFARTKYGLQAGTPVVA